MYNIEFYKEHYEEEWDHFVLKESINGTFLQTRRFINYHENGKFLDKSICVRKGEKMVAVFLASEIQENEIKTIFSHKGTSFGGMLISGDIYKTEMIKALFEEFELFIKMNGFEEIYMRTTPSIYCKHETYLIDYFLYYNKYEEMSELNFYIDLKTIERDILDSFSSSKRRDCRYSFNNNLSFKEVNDLKELKKYYEVYLKNLEKLNLLPVHSFEDMVDLRFKRFQNNVKIYAVYNDDEIVAGTMLFKINEHTYHTQYLSSDAEYLNLFPMEFLMYSLIEMCKGEKIDILSLGICTENQGRYINCGLSRFKEGFGCRHVINKIYKKRLK